VPIRREYRHLYHSPEWIRIRTEVLERAQHCCERCGRPSGLWVLSQGLRWFCSTSRRWRAPGQILIDLRPPLERGAIVPRPCGELYLVETQLSCAHINHVPGDDREENLAGWCRSCHLWHDRNEHKHSREVRKDLARPLFGAMEGLRAGSFGGK
jgi:5-methylcytosine-specific restriction endonuclease McrA